MCRVLSRVGAKLLSLGEAVSSSGLAWLGIQAGGAAQRIVERANSRVADSQARQFSERGGTDPDLGDAAHDQGSLVGSAEQALRLLERAHLVTMMQRLRMPKRN